MANSTEQGKQASIQSVFCSPTVLHGTMYETYVDYSLAGLNFLLAITAFVGNSLILYALKKETSFHPPTKLLYRTLTFTDLFVGLTVHPTSVVYHLLKANERWKLCHLTGAVGSFFGVILCGVSLGILTAISVDRLLALSLRLRYRQVVKLGRVRVVVIFLWFLNTVNASQPMWHTGDFSIFSCTMILICLIISTFCYSKIYLKLRRMQVQVQDSLHHLQPNESFLLNMARYKKSVSTAFLVHFALVACYAPYTVISLNLGLASNQTDIALIIVRYFAITLIYFNSSINPIFYCWRIKEVRQVVKDILKQLACRSVEE